MSIPLKRGFSFGKSTYQLRGFHGARMRVSQDLLASVAFVCVGGEPLDPTPVATGFMLNHRGARYFVTAKHVAEDLADAPFYLRFNQQGSGLGLLPIDFAVSEEPLFKWFVHPENSVDLAVLPFPIDIYSQGMVAVDLDSSDAVLSGSPMTDAGCGDMCHVIGLFSRASGKTRNIPVVHTGHIAAMSDSLELIPAESNGETVELEAYLVEISNLQGLSGAPVFVRGGVELDVPLNEGGNVVITAHKPDLKLLGVWSASWEKPTYRATERVPVGIGMVTPSYRLIELLELPDVAKNRTDWVTKLRAAKLDA